MNSFPFSSELHQINQERLVKAVDSTCQRSPTMLSMEPYGLRGVTRQKDQFEALDADLKQLRKTFHKNGQ